MKTFLFVNQSCYRRQEEISRVRRFLFLNGYAEETDLQTADLAVLFTCAFCQSRVGDMVGELRRIQSAVKPGCTVMVGSCLPKTDPASLRAVFTGPTLTPTDFSALNDLPGITLTFEEASRRPDVGPGCMVVAGRPVPEPPPSLRSAGDESDRNQRMGLFIAAGCRRACSYCAIRFATGPLRSKPLDVVLAELAEGLSRGYRRFEVYADSIGDYGADIGTSLGELFDRVLAREDEISLGIYDLHPDAFLRFHDRLSALARAGRLHYLYVPLQSGNARVLGLMNRPCDLDALRECLTEVARHRSVFLQTSIIVGFPTETDDEFGDTLAFLRAVPFDDVYVHCYSDMPRTVSARMTGKIAPEAMSGRLARLQAAGIKHNVAKARHELESVTGSSGLLRVVSND
jgi:tRNA A37 methylthiotransferase MiaB